MGRERGEPGPVSAVSSEVSGRREDFPLPETYKQADQVLLRSSEQAQERGPVPAGQALPLTAFG